MQSIAAGGQWLAFDHDRLRHRKYGVLVGSRAPGIRLPVTELAEACHAIGHQFSPNLAAPILATRIVNRRARVLDGDSDRSDELGHGSFLIVAAGG